MNITLKEVQKRLNLHFCGKENDNFQLKNLLFDSRKLSEATNSVFFAIKTKTNNGENYISQLYEKGVRAFVVASQNNIDYSLYPQATFLLSPNVVATLQDISTLKREKYIHPLLALTGSNGKTIVKDWICQLAKGDRKVCASPRSYNSQIGVALSLWNLDNESDFALIEAGISQRGEMQRLNDIIKPSIGLITNIGDAHQAYFSSIEEKIEEKIKLFEGCQTIIYCSEDKQISKAIKAKYPLTELISWGEEQEDTFFISKVETKTNCKSTTIHYIHKDKQNSFTIPFNDKASIQNAINAFVACIVLGLETQTLEEKTPLLHTIEMRLQMKEGINNNLLINDSYSSDLMSLRMALESLSNQKEDKKRTAILSDITESDLSQQDLYSQINSLLLSHGVTSLIGIGLGFIANKNLFTLPCKAFSTTEAFLKECSLSGFKDQIILIKGAREFCFEKITNLLERKAHQTVLEINLSAIAHNVNYYHSCLKEGVKLMAMVKAHSYGCGGYEVASFLAQNHKADYLTVAFADEGVELRSHNVSLPIMVAGPERESISKIIHYNLEPEVYSLSLLDELIRAKKDYELIGERKPLNVHIKLDTGMHRMGMEEGELDLLISILKQNPDIVPVSIFSHLCCADMPELDNFTLKQIEKFEAMSSKIQSAFPFKIMRHLANSAAIIRFPQAQYDMVRLGVGMYGTGVNPQQEKKLQPVHALKTVIVLKRHIKRGEGVSYGLHFVAPKDMTIGVLPIGYADGLLRQRGNERGKVWCNGYIVPILGNICMDLCMIDLTDVECSEGDQVELFGTNYSVNNVAKELDTITYEVFTSVSSRVKRVFYQE
jgi:alanine racemase